MLRIVGSDGHHHVTRKLIILFGILTVGISMREPAPNSDLSGQVLTLRFTLLWLVGASCTVSTVEHSELGVAVRLGPFGTYLALELHEKILVR